MFDPRTLIVPTGSYVPSRRIKSTQAISMTTTLGCASCRVNFAKAFVRCCLARRKELSRLLQEVLIISCHDEQVTSVCLMAASE